MFFKLSLYSCILYVLCLGCSRKGLDDDDFCWQPYKRGDQLIFSNDEGSLDSFEVFEIKTSSFKSDPLDVFPEIIEKTEVFVRSLDSEKNTSFPLLTIYGSDSKDNIPNVLVNFRSGLYEISGSGFFWKTSEYENLDADQVFIIEKKDGDILLSSNDLIQTIFWSKKNGLTGYNLRNGDSWSLIF